jgi:hypothetical protein
VFQKKWKRKDWTWRSTASMHTMGATSSGGRPNE